MIRLTLPALILGFVLTATEALAQAIPNYRLAQIVGPIPDQTALSLAVHDLNDRGEVLFQFNSPAGLTGVLWRAGASIAIRDDSDEGFSLEPRAVSDRSVVVGVKFLPGVGGGGPFLWRSGEVADIMLFPNALPHDINSLNMIVGEHLENGVRAAFFKWGKHLRSLPALPGGSGARVALRINEFGVIAGESDSASGQRAVIWVLGRVHELGLLPGATGSSLGDINDRGDVAVNIGFPNGMPRVAIWHRGRLTELPQLHSDTASLATGINNHRQVVGTAFGQTGEELALLWHQGNVYDLNDLVRADDPIRPFVTLVAAQRINNRGQILALGRDTRGFEGENVYPFLLNPVGGP